MEATKAQIRAACYCRISSDPQDKRQGTQRQREDTAVMCEVNGWTPVDYYVDDDKSASNGKDQRPNWERLLVDMKAGLIDAVVVWNQDRGWRKMADLEDLRPLFASLGVKLATTNIGIIDFNNPDDVFRAQVSTALSEMEVAKMKVRMRRAALQKAELGKPQWRYAFGYLDEGDERVPDPEVAPLVRQAYAAIMAGSSLGDICRLFNDAGALTKQWVKPKDAAGNTIKDAKPEVVRRPWTQPQMSNFLRKHRNAGLRSHTYQGVRPDGTRGRIIDEIGKANWPGLVDESTWRAVQTKMNAPGRAPGRKSVRRHLLTSLLLCGKAGCGGTLSGSWTTGKTLVYACKRCHGVSVRAEHVERRLYRLIGGRLAEPDAVDLLKAKIHDEAEAEAIRVQLAALYIEVDKIGVERGELLLTGPQAKVATDIVNAKIATLESQQQDQERLRVFDGIPLGKPEAVDAVNELSPARFRAVMGVLMTVTIKPVGKGGYLLDPATNKKRIDPDRVVIDWRNRS